MRHKIWGVKLCLLGWVWKSMLCSSWFTNNNVFFFSLQTPSGDDTDVTFTVNSIEEEDLGVTFELSASNSYGQNSYSFNITGGKQITFVHIMERSTYLFHDKSLDRTWRHQMEAFSASLAICEGNPPVTGGSPSQRPVTGSFDLFFDLRLNKRLSKQSRRRWLETLSGSLWRHCNKLCWNRADAACVDCKGINITLVRITCSARRGRLWPLLLTCLTEQAV